MNQRRVIDLIYFEFHLEISETNNLKLFINEMDQLEKFQTATTTLSNLKFIQIILGNYNPI